MKLLCLLAVVIASIAGCASTPGSEPGKAPAGERVSDAYVPIGTIIPRKRSQGGAPAAPVAEVDKQALENERAMSSRQ
jgi:hypothetical protein